VGRWEHSDCASFYGEVVHKYDGEYEGLGFGADLLLTLKFDEAGNWKIVKIHRMSKKELQKEQ
jgi:hypothetical protein